MLPTREQYAEALVPIASQIVAAVHDDGPGELRAHLTRARALPAPPDLDPDDVLITILAAMVDPDRSPGDLLAWVGTWAGSGARIPAPEPVQLAVVGPRQRSKGTYDQVRVDQCVGGGLDGKKLTTAEREEVVKVLHDLGVNDADIERRTRIPDRTVLRVRRRLDLPALGKAAA